jgi:hypothetical protein
MPLPGVDIERRVGLLERTRHNRMRFTEALKQYFDVSLRKREERADARPRRKTGGRGR